LYIDSLSCVNPADIDQIHSDHQPSPKICTASASRLSSKWRFYFHISGDGDETATAFGADAAVFAATNGACESGARAGGGMLKKASN